jgi:hypothetical protein
VIGVPTINEYTYERGYYIRARPSDASGTLTYKIRSHGYPIIDDMNVADGDEITWDSIQALKALGLIYTEGSGTITPDDFDPDPNQLTRLSLSQQEAENLLGIIQRHVDLDDSRASEIESLLGLDSVPSDIETKRDEGRFLAAPGDDGDGSIRTINDHRIDHLKQGSVYKGVVDRVSQNGNGIVVVDDGSINIGPTDSTAVGEVVEFEYLGSGNGRLQTREYFVDSVPESSRYPGLTDSQRKKLDNL